MLIKLGEVPPTTATHHWADYVELLALTNLDGEFSRDDLLERWKGQDDIAAPAETLDDDDPPLLPSFGASKGDVDDRRRQVADDVFAHLDYRARTFDAAYPFEVHTGSLGRLRRRRASKRRQLYVFLLLASSLRNVPIKRRSSFTSPFERLAAEVLRAWLPKGAEVHPFGTGDSRSRYRGTMWQKLETLSSDLNERIGVDESSFAPTDTGDLGLDVVAWLPLGDTEPSLPVWFAQVTCQKDWKAKQYESGKAWESYLSMRAPRGNLLFVPYCFRDAAGRWYDPKWPVAAVVLDRQRVLWLLRAAKSIKSIPYELITEIMRFREAA